MTEFIIGPAGSGKSTLIAKKAVDCLSQGRRVILMVPEQSAVNTEAAVCSEAQSRGIPQTELEVLNFRRLCNRVFRQYGGIAYNSVTPGAKALIMWQALFSSAPALKRYKDELADAKRFIPMLLSTISEFKSYGITAAMLADAAKEAAEDDMALADKLSDLSLICSAYDHFAEQGFSDPSDDLTRLAEVLSKNRFFDGVDLFLDSFVGFTPQELSVLSYAFRQADNVTVSLCLSEDEGAFAFENVRGTFESLNHLAERHRGETVITRLPDTVRFSSDALKFLEKNLWSMGGCRVFDGDASPIRTVIAEGEYSEAEFVANDILTKVIDGAHYRDFAVIARDIRSYSGIVDAVFSEAGLPCHISERAELSEKPIFKLILSALAIKNNGWNTSDIVSYMKTGLSPVTPDECDMIESYAFQWSISGRHWCGDDWFMNPDGFTDVMTEEGMNTLSEINAIRKRLVDPLSKLFESFDGTRSVKELCRAVWTFLHEIGADEKISSSGDEDAIRLWNSLCDSLDTLALILPETKADTVLFANLLTLVVDQTNVGTLPSVIDEISLGSAGLMRAGNIKHVYLLGVNEGVFPAACGENGIFSDSDKAVLETYGINLSPNSDLMSVNELFGFYTAACLASDSVTIICSEADVTGKKLKPSVAFTRITEMFPDARCIHTAKMPLIYRIGNKKTSFPICTLYPNTKEAAALLQIYSEDPDYSPLLDGSRQPLSTEGEQLDPNTASEIFGGDISLTQSRLDRYVMCAFGFECDYVLKLKPKQKYEFGSADTGNLVHRILEKFFSSVTDGEGHIREHSPVQRSELIDKIIEDYISGIFCGHGKHSLTEREMNLFLRLRRSVTVLINNLLEEFGQSEFVPAFFEMRITNGGADGTVAPLEIPLPDGTRAYVYGIADRVDICRKGNDAYVRVIDYKTGSRDFSLSDIALGLNLQMLLYLFSIWKDCGGNFRRTLGITGEIIPAGVLYCTAKTSDVTVTPNTTESEILASAADTLKRRGLAIDDESVLRMMEKKLAGKYIPVTVKKDGSLKTSLTLESLEGIGKLMNEVCATASRLAYAIKSGNASARPLKDERHDGCLFCPHRSICRSPAAFTAAK